MDWFQISFAFLIGLAIICIALLIKVRAVATSSRRERELCTLDAALIQVPVKGRKEPRYQAIADMPHRCRIVTAPYPAEITAKRKLEKMANKFGFTLNWLRRAA